MCACFESVVCQSAVCQVVLGFVQTSQPHYHRHQTPPNNQPAYPAPKSIHPAVHLLDQLYMLAVLSILHYVTA